MVKVGRNNISPDQHHYPKNLMIMTNGDDLMKRLIGFGRNDPPLDERHHRYDQQHHQKDPVIAMKNNGLKKISMGPGCNNLPPDKHHHRSDARKQQRMQMINRRRSEGRTENNNPLKDLLR